MQKTLTYGSFAIAALLVILTFVTAKTYTQLAIAVILYPALAYFALKIFPQKIHKKLEFKIQTPKNVATKVEEVKEEKVNVVDIDKRTFLKLAGTVGMSYFIFSLLGRKAEDLIFGRNLATGVTPPSSPAGNGTDLTGTLQTNEYKITEVDNDVVSYYGFTNKDGGWFVMREDPESGSFRYSRGDSDFSRNWSNRKNLKYDYFYNLF